MLMITRSENLAHSSQSALVWQSQWQSLLDGLHPASLAPLSEPEKREFAFFLRQKGVRSEDTARLYRSQLEKFFAWLSLTEVKRIDEWVLMDYQKGLLSPTEAMQRMPGIAFNPVPQETVDQYMAPVRSFLSFIHDKGLSQYNPSSFVPRLGVRNRQATGRSRHFLNDQWQSVLATLNQLPEATPGQKNRRERMRYCILVGYGAGLRIREHASHSHEHLVRVENGWALDLVGKGRRARRITLTHDSQALDAIIRYRRYLRLKGEPQGEPLPLLPTVNPVLVRQRGVNKGIHINARSISPGSWEEQFKKFLRVDVMQYVCPDDPVAQAAEFQARWSHLTPHSLRHTRLTHLVEEGRELFWVQQFAGHERLDTTAQYFQAQC